MKQLLTILFVICMLGLNLVEHVDYNTVINQNMNDVKEGLVQDTKQLKVMNEDDEKSMVQLQ